MTNRPRPDSTRADMVSAGSNVIQNFQLRKQNRLQEQSLEQQTMQTELNAQQLAMQSHQLAMQSQQLAMEQDRERKRLEIIERRKLLIKFESLCDRASTVFSEYPEYSTMMMENARDSFQNSGLSADYFEEIADMERANNIFSRITEISAEFRTKLDNSQTITLSSMREFLNSEDYLLQEHTGLCQDVEQMHSSEDRANELLTHKEKLDTLHQEKSAVFRSGLWKRTKWSLALLLIGMVIVLGGGSAGVFGECLEYDEDEVCQTYENNTLFNAALICFGILAMPLGLLPWWAVYAFYQSLEFRREWTPFEQEFAPIQSLRLRVISNEDRYQMLSQQFQTSSSIEAIELRNELKNWINDLSPMAHEINLNV